MTVEAVRAKVWREDPAWSPQVISQTATYFASLNNPTLWLSPSSSTCSACSACLLCLRHSYPSFKAPVKAHLPSVEPVLIPREGLRSLLSLCFHRRSCLPLPLAYITFHSRPPRGCFPTSERRELPTSVNVFLLQDA